MADNTGQPGGAIGEAIDSTIDNAVDGVVGAAGDVVVGPAITVLNEAGAALAGTVFGDLADDLALIGQPTTIVLGGFEVAVHLLAGYVAFAVIATTLLAAIITPGRRMGQRVGWTAVASTKYVLVSTFGVVAGTTAIEASRFLTLEAIDLGLTGGVDTSEANLYTGAVAAVIVPLVGVAFEFQAFLVAALIAFWPLAAAVAITRTFRHALPVLTALITANVLWPPLAALAVGKAFTALPDVGAATWWCLAAITTAPLVNLIALSARSTP
ncbi:MAG: hypothetical protein ACK5RL_08525 [Acidimicrobiales bacterium]